MLLEQAGVKSSPLHNSSQLEEGFCFISMKKILLFAYLCLSLVLLTHEEFRVGPNVAHPCERPGILTTVVLRQVMIHFSCGVSVVEQHRIMDFTAHALDNMPPGILPHADIFAFTSLEQGVAAESAFLKGKGYSPSTLRLQADWLDNGFLGQAFKDAIFLDVGNSAWSRDPSIPSLTVLHEMHHLLQYELLASNRPIPLWLQEGGADEFALRQLSALGLPAPARNTSPEHCDYSLADLERERPEVPLACAYVEGAQAVRLLLDGHGQGAYYLLLRNLGASSSFEAAFGQTYGIRLEDFYRRFEAYRKASYTINPALESVPIVRSP
jgi:hypothetical protein